LVDNVYEQNKCFTVTGIQDANLQTQINNFINKLNEVSKKKFAATNTWQDVFFNLKEYTSKLSKKKKHVIFIDELPWINTAKSGFIQLLAHFWNDYLSKEKNFILVICGSASSWITKKIVNDKGGLHNRLTETINVPPFSFAETKQFFESKKVLLSNHNIVMLYMAFGGVPYYLNLIKKGESVPTALERLCFKPGGSMQIEYNNLYKALFQNATNHEAIVGVLASSKQGIPRDEIIKKSKVQSGGPYNRAMEDLINSGFVEDVSLIGRKKRGSLYRLIDEYSIFYHRFIKNTNKYTAGIWVQIMQSQSYKIWCGFAFEAFCFKHLSKLNSVLGIAGVFVQYYALSIPAQQNYKGVQIDLLIDRNDGVINLCEVKFYDTAFTLTKAYAQELLIKKQRLKAHLKSNKQVLITMITSKGIISNSHFLEAVDCSITLDDMLE
jgi:uncharacterized protein